MYRYQPRGYYTRSSTAGSSSYRADANRVSQGHHHTQVQHDRRAYHLNYSTPSQPYQHRPSDYQNVRQLDEQEPQNRTGRLQLQRYQEAHPKADSHCQICSFTQPYPAPQKPVSHSHFRSISNKIKGADRSGGDRI